MLFKRKLYQGYDFSFNKKTFLICRKTRGEKMIVLNIVGKPIAWKRPAPANNKYGGTWMYDLQKKEKEQVRWQMRSYFKNECLLACPCKIEYIFSFKPPEGTSKKRRALMLNGEIKHDQKPDFDNLAKFYGDCLNGCVLVDDRQIYECKSSKIWAEDEGTIVMITPQHCHVDLGKSTILKDLDLPSDFFEQPDNPPTGDSP
jgi:Holliday junction resolvase RusA-like endonuclease